MDRHDGKEKENVYKLLWLLDYLPFYEINLYSNIGISNPRHAITDIDVLGIKLNKNLAIEKIISECKGGKRTSSQPIGTALKLKGLMDICNAEQGIVVVNKPISIPEEHKIVAHRLKIKLFNSEELEKFLNNFTLEIFQDTEFYKYSTFKDFIRKTFQSNSNLKPLKSLYLYEFWIKSDESKIRYLLGKLRKSANSVNPKSRFHKALITEMIALSTIGLQIILSYFYPIYLSPESKDYLSDRLKKYLYGGKENYDFFNNLYKIAKEFKKTKGERITTTQDLSLPHWEEFIQLFKNILENPLETRFIPHLFRLIGMERFLYKKEIKPNIIPVTNTMLKIAIDISEYIFKTTNLPQEIHQEIKEEIQKLIQL